MIEIRLDVTVLCVIVYSGQSFKMRREIVDACRVHVVLVGQLNEMFEPAHVYLTPI